MEGILTTQVLARWTALGIDLARLDVGHAPTLADPDDGRLHHFGCSLVPNRGVSPSAPTPLTAYLLGDLHDECLGRSYDLLGRADAALDNLVEVAYAQSFASTARVLIAEARTALPRSSPGARLKLLRAAAEPLVNALSHLEGRIDSSAGRDDPALAEHVEAAEAEVALVSAEFHALVQGADVADFLLAKACKRLRARTSAPKKETIKKLLVRPVPEVELTRPALLILDEERTSDFLGAKELVVLAAFNGSAECVVVPVAVAQVMFKRVSVLAAARLKRSDSPEVIETATTLWRDDEGSLRKHLVTARAVAAS